MVRMIVLSLVILLPSAAAGREAQNPDNHTIAVILPGGKEIRAELAATQQQRQLGLMFRPSMPEDHGMLFVFDLPGPHPFWMKSTLIPLDIIWMDKNKQIVYIASSVPPCKMDPCPQYGSKAGSLYVLEVNAGMAGRWGLKEGSTLQF